MHFLELEPWQQKFKSCHNASNGQLQLDGILGFFTGLQAEGKSKTGPDLLFVLECLVSPVDVGVFHILKTMAQHAGAEQSSVEDDLLQLLFHMISTGILTEKKAVPDLEDVKSSSSQHSAQLYRHIMQILEASLTSDNGSTAEYIETHQLMFFSKLECNAVMFST